jgi:protoporphyrinogen oxidase
MAEALIIGAGPAGLSAAYELGKLGLHATVLEADQQVGGLSRTINYRGYRFDVGGHRFFSKVPLVNELWHEILGADFLLRPRQSRIYYRGRFFEYPLKPLNALAGLGPLDGFLICLSYARAKLTQAEDEYSFEQWVTNRSGRRLYEIFFKTYTEKVWGIPCSEISADWATQRIRNLSLGEALRHALFGQAHARDGRVITSLTEQFHYPRFGPGMMWERCAERVELAGGRVLCGVRVERIRHAGGRVESVHGRTAAGEAVEVTAPQVISTMPIRDLIDALDPPPPDEVRRAAGQLRYRDYLTVVLIVRRASVFPDNWIYIHSPEVKLGRIQNYKNWSPDMVPDPARTSLGLEYFLWDKDPEWAWPDQQLIEAGVRDCARIGIITAAEVDDGVVLRVPKAYPVYDQAYRANLALIRRYLQGLVNLQLVGRNGQHRYNNQDHSMLAGVYAARNLTGARHDVWSVNTETEYLEEVGHARPSPRLVPTRTRPAPAMELSAEAVTRRVFARLDPVALGAAFGCVAAVGLFMATAVLLLKGGPTVGPNLSLLGHFLIGFRVTWAGAVIGFIEAGTVGFGLGYVTARLRNWLLGATATLLQRRAAADWRRSPTAPG